MGFELRGTKATTWAQFCDSFGQHFICSSIVESNSIPILYLKEVGDSLNFTVIYFYIKIKN